MLEADTNKNYKAEGEFTHETPKHLEAPKAGSPLYHITASKYSDNSKMQEKSSHPVTWFTSGHKGYNGAKETEASFHEGPSSG